MLPKVKLVFDRKSKCKENPRLEGDVEVYVYHVTKKRYLSTGVRCYRREYRDGVISGRTDAVELNKRIQWCVRQVQTQINAMVENDCVDLSSLTLSLTDRNSCFYEWCEDVIEKRDIREGTRSVHRNALNSLRKLKPHLMFSEISLRTIEDYEYYYSKRILGSSRRSYHNVLRLYMGLAAKQQLLPYNPYRDFVLPKVRSHNIKYLLDDERAKIERTEMPSGRKNMQIAKDMFLLACYTGLAYSDIRKISVDKVENSGGRKWLVDSRTKTNTEYRILLLPAALSILERYNWNMDVISTSSLNIALKEVAAVSGLGKNLTLHMGRHTFATWALSQGVRIEVVSKMLAHTDIKTTQIYAKVLQAEVDRGYDLLASRLNVE